MRLRRLEEDQYAVAEKVSLKDGKRKPLLDAIHEPLISCDVRQREALYVFRRSALLRGRVKLDLAQNPKRLVCFGTHILRWRAADRHTDSAA